jgi:leader peptidase (prepilin peptidase)/N-methyltransferase
MPVDLASGAALGLLLLLAMSAALIDLRRMIIPDAITLALALSGLVAALLLPSLNIFEALLGGLVGGGGVYVLRVAHRQLRGIEGLGLGDVKFIAAGGAWTGLYSLPVFLLVAALCGLGYVTLRAVMRRPLAEDERIPFAPFLAGGLITVGARQIAGGSSVYDLLLLP